MTTDDQTLDHAAAVAVQDAPETPDVPDTERYRLVSIESVRAPEGCTGQDWYEYRIAQGGNGITGYRRGSREKVSTEVDTIIVGLNGRRQWTKSKSDAKAERRAAAARRKKSE